ncbi:MAG: peroxiredoxin [Pseudomonadota bacterium]
MSLRVRPVLAILLAFSAACAPIVRPDGGNGLLPIGTMAPEVVGEAPDGSVTRLTAVRGHSAIVYFYPKDGTPGCTKEACAFRDAFRRYEQLHVTIFGVSGDSNETHAEFRESHHLPFSLVSDQSGAVARAYGVSSTPGMDARVTFLVGGDGKIARVWPDVDPGVHAKEVLAAVEGADSAR